MSNVVAMPPPKAASKSTVDPRPSAEWVLRFIRDRYTPCRSTGNVLFVLPKSGPTAHVGRELGAGLRAELASAFEAETGRVAPARALTEALETMAGSCRAAEPIPLATRHYRHDDGRVFIDTGSAAVIEIVPGQGWGYTNEVPCAFRRDDGFAPMIEPADTGDLNELRALLNVDEDSWYLIRGWMVASLIPGMTTPILMLRGEHGTGKSHMVEVLKRLVDPSTPMLGTDPANEGDWISTLVGSRVVALDNVSAIPRWWSDSLCRAVTGAGQSKRKLYSDNERTVVEVKAPIVMATCDPGSLRSDLAERVMLIDVPRIQATERRTDELLWAEFDRKAPRILAALLSLASQVMGLHREIRLPALPRVADFGALLAAIDDIDGSDGLDVFNERMRIQSEEVVEGDVVGNALQRYAEVMTGPFEGTMTQLLDVLTLHAPSIGRSWPGNAIHLAGRINRIRAELESVGIIVGSIRTKSARLVTVSLKSGEYASSERAGIVRRPRAWEGS